MRLWHTIFIITFVMLYGSSSVVLLASWAHEKAKALKAALREPAPQEAGKRRLGGLVDEAPLMRKEIECANSANTQL